MSKDSAERKEQKKVATARPRALSRAVRHSADRELHRTHAPIEDRSGGDAAPRIVAVMGPKASGKSCIIQALVKHYTHRKLEQVRGPVTMVTSRTKRLTLLEVPPELPSMIDAAKIADLALLVINAAVGFEMETFEFLSVAAAHGMPRVLGVLTHLDAFKDSKKCSRMKKMLKDRLASEIIHGAKLFYLSGMREHGEYLKREVQNLARFISVIKYRPISWRNDHPFVLIDRVEDMTLAQHATATKADRHLLLHGFVHGSPLRLPTVFHVPGLGDFTVDEALARPDPIPPPAAEEVADDAKGGNKRRRSLQRKERFVYAPMANLDGVFFDPDALFVNIPDAYVRFTPSDLKQSASTANQPASEDSERLSTGELMVRALQDTNTSQHQQMSSLGLRLFDNDQQPLYSMEVCGKNTNSSLRVTRPAQYQGTRDRDLSIQRNAAHSPHPSWDASDESIQSRADEDVQGVADAMSGPRLSSIPRGGDQNPREDKAATLLSKEQSSEMARMSDAYVTNPERNASWKDSSDLENQDTSSRSSATSDELFSIYRETTHHLGLGRHAIPANPQGDNVEECEAADSSDSETSFLARFVGAGRNPAFRQQQQFSVSQRSTPTGDAMNLTATACDPERDERRHGGMDDGSISDSCSDQNDISDDLAGERNERMHGGMDDGSTSDSCSDQNDISDDFPGPSLAREIPGMANNLPTELSNWLQGQSAHSAFQEISPRVTRDDFVTSGTNERNHDLSRQERATDEPQTTARHDDREPRSNSVTDVVLTVPEDVRFHKNTFPPGTYVRLELHPVPAAFVEHFDPRRPLILGALPLPAERTQAMMRIRMLRHRWFRRLLKTRDPLLFSIGWHRFESVPIFCLEDSTGRHRMLKYTLEHMHCEAMIYGPALPPGSGVVCFQSLGSERSRDFRIAATGVVCELDHSFRIVKKLKLVGEPHRIFKNTAFIRGMFNSELEVNRFTGALLRTPSGLRGVVKRPVRDGPPGTFRATFEDRLLMSDLVFMRAWVPVTPPSFYHPTRNLLEPAPWASTEPHRTYRWIRTARELRATYQVPASSNPDSAYRPIERLPRHFHPLRIPRALESALPFASKPKQVEALNERKRRRLELASPGLVERMPSISASERKEAQFLHMLRTVRKERASIRAAAEKQKRQIHERLQEQAASQRLAKRQARQRDRWAQRMHASRPGGHEQEQ
jgi:ribosome biogenesis protein BMS1